MSAVAETKAALPHLAPSRALGVDGSVPAPTAARTPGLRTARLHLPGPIAAAQVLAFAPTTLAVTPTLLLLAASTLTWSVLLVRAGRAHDVASPRLGLRGIAVSALQLAVIGSAALWWALPEAPHGVLLGTVAAMAVATATVDTSAARRKALPRRTLVVGPTDQLTDLTQELLRSRSVQVVGQCHPNPMEMLRAAAASEAEVVVVRPTPELDAAALRRLEWQLAAEGRDLLVATGLVGVERHRARVEVLGDACLVRVRPSELRSTRRSLHHVAGRVVAAAMLLVLTPLLAVLVAAVRLDSPGPAFFRQRRVGINGAEFTMLKLRTMTHRAHDLRDDLDSDGDGVLFKMRRDPRITRLGAILRRYSLDELPQLINVVRGDMALVGPRPALPEEVAQYGPDVRRRLAVLPGLTGLWQVSGRSDLSWDDAVRLDLRYVDNWTPAGDLEIIARTAGAVVSHRGAY